MYRKIGLCRLRTKVALGIFIVMLDPDLGSARTKALRPDVRRAGLGGAVSILRRTMLTTRAMRGT